tara:strand:- start:193 stop:468 length:276 start_codon:yes stop_codon:yes gene_type:complete
MPEIDETRLARIEEKVDKLSQLMEEFARIDERVISISRKFDRLEKRLDWVEDDTKEMKEEVLKNTTSAKMTERIMWLVFSSALGFIVYFMR